MQYIPECFIGMREFSNFHSPIIKAYNKASIGYNIGCVKESSELSVNSTVR